MKAFTVETAGRFEPGDPVLIFGRYAATFEQYLRDKHAVIYDPRINAKVHVKLSAVTHG